MKRFFALFVVLLMVISSVSPAVADGRIDFSDLSLDGLIMLKTWINEEIAERTKNEKAVIVPTGLYIIGEDIPAGTYTITNVSERICSTDVRVYDSEGEQIYDAILYNGEQIGKLSLGLGLYVEIANGAVEFSTYKGLGF